MTKSSPPVLPERKLRRVITIARADSLGVLICSGGTLLLSLFGGDVTFAIFAALALVAGGMERHGASRLQSGAADGLSWLTGAQLCLYTVVIGYVVWRLRFFDPGAHWEQLPSAARDHIHAEMEKAGLDPAQDRLTLLRMMNVLVCAILTVLSTLYQGGLALWYRLQRTAVLAALGNPSTDTDRGG